MGADNELMYQICAGIVTYNPDCRRLKECLKSIENQINNVIIIDNGSDNVDCIKEIFEIVNNVSFKITLIQNQKNLGLAKALNQEAEEALNRGFSWLLTLDQDTVCSNDIIKNYRKLVNLKDIGIITCGNVFNEMEIKKNTINKRIKYKEIDNCITGGSLLNLNIWSEIKGFDEQLFIEWIDYDFCKAVRNKGYRILKQNFIGIYQIGGIISEKRLFGKTYKYSSYSAERRYYQIRNCIYYIRKYSNSEESDIKWALKWIYVYLKMTILFENKKLSKLYALICGIKDGFKMKIKCSE